MTNIYFVVLCTDFEQRNSRIVRFHTHLKLWKSSDRFRFSHRHAHPRSATNPLKPMSAVHQFRARENEALTVADPVMLIAAPEPARDPLQLLRDAIASLKSSNGDLPDQAQVANLLA